MPSFGIGLAGRQEHLFAFHVYKQNGYTMLSGTNPSPYKPHCPTHYMQAAWSCEPHENIRPFLYFKTGGGSCKRRETLYEMSVAIHLH
jgi:hypothetical protein